MRLTLFLVHKSGLDVPTFRRSQRETLAFEHKIDILVLRGEQIIDLVKYGGLVLSAIRPVGSAHCKIKLSGISAPLTFVVLKLIAMLLQDDTHQLTARPDTGLREELLKCSFDRAFRYSNSCRNLFIRKALEHT